MLINLLLLPFLLLNPLLSCFVLTASSAYTGAIIGIFIAALIVGSAAVIAKTVYSSRHRICLGNLLLSVLHKTGSHNACNKCLFAHMRSPYFASVTFCIGIYTHTLKNNIKSALVFAPILLKFFFLCTQKGLFLSNLILKIVLKIYHLAFFSFW